jgi:hypothetical protein
VFSTTNPSIARILLFSEAAPHKKSVAGIGEIFVWNKDKSTGIAALFRAFWTPFPRKKIREDGAHDLCGVALNIPQET